MRLYRGPTGLGFGFVFQTCGVVCHSGRHSCKGSIPWEPGIKHIKERNVSADLVGVVISADLVGAASSAYLVGAVLIAEHVGVGYGSADLSEAVLSAKCANLAEAVLSAERADLVGAVLIAERVGVGDRSAELEKAVLTADLLEAELMGYMKHVRWTGKGKWHGTLCYSVGRDRLV